MHCVLKSLASNGVHQSQSITSLSVSNGSYSVCPPHGPRFLPPLPEEGKKEMKANTCHSKRWTRQVIIKTDGGVLRLRKECDIDTEIISIRICWQLFTFSQVTCHEKKSQSTMQTKQCLFSKNLPFLKIHLFGCIFHSSQYVVASDWLWRDKMWCLTSLQLKTDLSGTLCSSSQSLLCSEGYIKRAFFLYSRSIKMTTNRHCKGHGDTSIQMALTGNYEYLVVLYWNK